MVALHRGTILLSYPVLAELYEVLARPKLRRYLDEADIRSFLAALTHEAEFVGQRQISLDNTFVVVL